MKEIRNKQEAEQSLALLAVAEAELSKLDARAKVKAARDAADLAAARAPHDTSYRREWERLSKWANQNRETVGTGLPMSAGTIGFRTPPKPALETVAGTTWNDVIKAICKEFPQAVKKGYLRVKTEVAKDEIRKLGEDQLASWGCFFNRTPVFFIDTTKTA